jgi:hypothetical protein
VDLGVQYVKNLQEPIRAYQVSALSETQEAASLRVADGQSPPPLPDKPSIPVLPFQNMSGDPEQKYFSDGMVEDIITALSRFKSLFVIARKASYLDTIRRWVRFIGGRRHLLNNSPLSRGRPSPAGYPDGHLLLMAPLSSSTR